VSPWEWRQQPHHLPPWCRGYGRRLLRFFLPEQHSVEQKTQLPTVFAMHPVSRTLSAGQNLYSDFARAAHDFLSRNGHTSVGTRILLSQLGAALAPLKPADASFKWSQVFAAHPQLFQMLDLELPGKATIYALPSQRQRPQSHRAPATPSAAAAPSSTALVPLGARGGGALALRTTDSAAHLTASVLKSLRAGPGTCTHEEVFVRHDSRVKAHGSGHASAATQSLSKPKQAKGPKLPSTADIVFSFDTTGSMAPYIQKVIKLRA
jgi:hypothetical protein